MASKKFFAGGAVFDPLAISTIEDDEDVPFYDDDELPDADEGNAVAETVSKPTEAVETARPSADGSGDDDDSEERELSKEERKALKRKARQEKRQRKQQAQTETKEAKATGKVPAKPQKKGQGENEMQLNPNFLFQADGGFSIVGPGHPWDFTAAKAALKLQQKTGPGYSSIDDKIAKAQRLAKERTVKKPRVSADAADAPADSGEEQLQGDREDDDDKGKVELDDEDGFDIDGEFEAGSDEDDEEPDALEDDLQGEDAAEDADEDGDAAQEEDGEDDIDEDVDEDEDDEDEDEDLIQEKRKAEFFAQDVPAAADASEIESFTHMKISRPILKGLSAMGFTKPTAIQARTIPVAMQGRDICGAAVTGSGKTAAFTIPVLERLLFRPKNIPTTRVLILVPTRELGVQCHSVCQNIGKFTDIQFSLCVGGLSTKVQEVELRKRPDVVIATPGRLIDHIRNSQSFNLDSIEILIIDEADRILEDGFKDELNEIIENTPKGRQTILFSATMTDNVDDLVKLSLNKPLRLFVDHNQSIAKKLVQEFIRVRSHKEDSRPAILVALCRRTYKSEVIIFFRSKAAAHHMKIVFGLLGLKAAELHGNLTQLQRLEALEAFRDHQVDFLLATDLASRGLDIAGIKTVINYDMPKIYAQYVHRVGRTARGEQGGRAVSLVGEADRKVLKMAVKNSQDQVKHRVIPPSVVAKFEKKVLALTDTIKDIYRQEKEEKELRQADMEMAKAENMIKYEDEIRSRPAKTWFQTEQERTNARAMTLVSSPGCASANSQTSQFECRGSDKPQRGKFDGLSRHQKRTRLAREEDAKELGAQKAAARSAKRGQRQPRLHAISEGSASKAGPAAKKKKADIFGDEMKKASAGKKSGSGRKTSSSAASTKSDARAKPRLGKIKSKNAFKSKSRYKRR
ncbi:P-loop containing nucleoside triphosphate hydrolase protein [Polychytrium aggregatum]|uniref:P-loop containing nucleoside triphosphate hydrolase protein n=1 Tax=Polychytrium aggregatum TaxID=110093 RepID=UPI0022FF134D|nr:P-loop containing nucleoside triphosphate hydrolase protein [Polychytrium aggregatum]KAI9197522.1 P-loop containing nucleoside triphosphate hydrolase protein [Polychytrium aggregatum]